MFAIIRENINIIDILLKHKPNINVYDNASNSVLDYAYNTNNEKIINMITEYYENNNF